MCRGEATVAGRTIAVGDVHGCSAALAALVEAVRPGPEDVLGSEVVVVECASLLLGNQDYLPGEAGEAFERPFRPPLPAWPERAPVTARRLARFVLNDLVNALVAQAEVLRDLPERASGRVEPTDGVLVVDPSALNVALEVDEPLAGLPRLPEKSCVERSDVV